MLGHVINMINRTSASGDRIFKLMEVEPEIANKADAIESMDIKGKVEFKDVSIAFDGQQILEDINLCAEPGSTIAIMGATGTGKTSLINLIARYYQPDQGEIYIDDTDINQIDLKSLRQQVSIVMQDTFLFSETIKENIAYGKPDATMEEIKEAARIAGAQEFIEEAEEGYETVVGERGMGLSGGQKQRVSLARAILKQAPILILDDATSAVDMETERQIQEALESMSPQSTVFIIAHRISSVRNADEILVLNNGTVSERGNHEELIELQGEYYDIFEKQHKEFLEEEYKNMLVGGSNG